MGKENPKWPESMRGQGRGLREPRFMSSERRIAGTLACKEDSLIPASISETVMGLGAWKQFWGKLIAPGPSRRSKGVFVRIGGQ